MTTRSYARRIKLAVGAITLAVVAAACGGGGNGGSSGTNKPTTASTGVSGTDPTNLKPTPGGELVYSLEATNTGGWCLAEAQLAIAGIQVARAVYDTLTMPDNDGNIKPYLAESVTANADNTEFVITLRDGVKFHDGTDLDADIVRDNLLAYMGKYPTRSPLLFLFVFAPYIKSVESTGPLEVTVTTNDPWPAFPWFLWGSSRVGIVARAQLDDEEACNTNIIGTGGFMLDSWDGAGGDFVAVKNPNYWQTDADGVPLPYLDKLTFVFAKPGEDDGARVASLRGGDFDIIHTSSSLAIAEIRKDVESGDLAAIESNRFGEVAYLMLNGAKAPFDNPLARQAVAYASDRAEANRVLAEDIPELAQGPFAPGNVGFLDDAGYPEYDLDKAKALVAQYEAETGEKLEFTYTHGSDAEGTRQAQYLKQKMDAAGITVNLKPIGDQTQYINEAIGKNFQAIGWRNHPGADPDTQWVWWHCDNEPPDPCTNPVNFGGWNDPEINDLLERGRASTDPAEKAQIYEELNREFARELYNLWSSYTLWSIAFEPTIHGILGPPLPDGSEPLDGLATGHSVLGMWVEQ